QARRLPLLNNPPLLTAQQLGPLDLSPLAIGDVPQNGEVAVLEEVRRGGELHVAHHAARGHETELARLPAGLEERSPLRVEVDVGIEELIEAAAHERGAR